MWCFFFILQSPVVRGQFLPFVSIWITVIVCIRGFHLPLPYPILQQTFLMLCLIIKLPEMIFFLPLVSQFKSIKNMKNLGKFKFFFCDVLNEKKKTFSFVMVWIHGSTGSIFYPVTFQIDAECSEITHLSLLIESFHDFPSNN